MLALLALLAASSPAQADRRSALDGEEVLRRWTFEASGSLAGWEAGAGIADLEVKAGSLRGRLTKPDAYLFAPPLEADLDGLAVRVRWSCPRAGCCQCYLATRRSPAMGEDRVVS